MLLWQWAVPEFQKLVGFPPLPSRSSRNRSETFVLVCRELLTANPGLARPSGMFLSDAYGLCLFSVENSLFTYSHSPPCPPSLSFSKHPENANLSCIRSVPSVGKPVTLRPRVSSCWVSKASEGRCCLNSSLGEDANNVYPLKVLMTNQSSSSHKFTPKEPMSLLGSLTWGCQVQKIDGADPDSLPGPTAWT